MLFFIDLPSRMQKNLSKCENRFLTAYFHLLSLIITYYHLLSLIIAYYHLLSLIRSRHHDRDVERSGFMPFFILINLCLCAHFIVQNKIKQINLQRTWVHFDKTHFRETMVDYQILMIMKTLCASSIFVLHTR